MENLVDEAKNGNKEAFTELVLNNKEDLYRIAKTRLSDDYDIDDAIQETMIAAFNSIKNLKENKYFKTWLIKILINKCNEIYRKKRKGNTAVQKYNITNFESTETLSKIENNLDFYLLIKMLSYEERIAIVLYYVYDYRIKDISEILEINENTIKARLARGKEKIKNKGGVYNG